MSAPDGLIRVFNSMITRFPRINDHHGGNEDQKDDEGEQNERAMFPLLFSSGGHLRLPLIHFLSPPLSSSDFTNPDNQHHTLKQDSFQMLLFDLLLINRFLALRIMIGIFNR
jgi:hypothetical protein